MAKTPDGKWKWMTKESIVNSGCDCFAVANGSRDWGSGNVYRDDPPIDDSGKPAIMDMDHIHPGSTDYRLPWKAFTRGYHFNLYDGPFENCIATWDGRLMRENHVALGYDGKPYTKWKDGSGKPRYYTNYGVDQPYGCFGRDRIDRGPTRGPFIYGCIAYRLKNQRVAPISITDTKMANSLTSLYGPGQ